MLPRALSLHSPSCRGACKVGDCVRDLEAFAGSIRAAHFNVGAKRSDGSIDGQLSLSSADADDVLAYLIGRGWELSQRFNPVDDGRGSNRLAGFLTQRLHFACTDWCRARWGSTRYGPRPVFTPTADPEVLITASWLDPEFDDGDALDLDSAPSGTREALELLQPLIDGRVDQPAQIARDRGVPNGRVQKAVQHVRAEVRRQGFAPPSAVEDERKALADQAADLRKQRLTYKQIADQLGLRSPHTVVGLLRDYRADVITLRALATSNGKPPAL